MKLHRMELSSYLSVAVYVTKCYSITGNMSYMLYIVGQ